MVEQFNDAARSTDFEMPPAIDVWTPTLDLLLFFVSCFMGSVDILRSFTINILTNQYIYDSIESIESVKSIESIGKAS
jgi:hypothetical protein